MPQQVIWNFTAQQLLQNVPANMALWQVTKKSEIECRGSHEKRKKRGSRKQSALMNSAQMTFAGRTSDEFWEVETDLKWETVTRASNERKPVRIVEADVKRDFALGRRYHVRVGQANLQL